MSHYFAELILTDQPVVIIGGGAVARRKLAGLLASGAVVTVVAPLLQPPLAERLARGEFVHVAEPYRPDHLQQRPKPVLVFAATSERTVNGQVAADCRQSGILCNVVDDPAASGFLVPAMVRRQGVTLAIGTGGQSPALARVIKEHLDTLLDPGWGPLVQAFGAWRQEVRHRLPDAGQRERFWRQTALLALQQERFRQRDGESWLAEQLQKFILADKMQNLE